MASSPQKLPCSYLKKSLGQYLDSIETLDRRKGASQPPNGGPRTDLTVARLQLRDRHSFPKLSNGFLSFDFEASFSWLFHCF